MKRREFVAYFRVSSKAQGRSGLGLEAQRAAVFALAGDTGDILGEFTEIETGRVDDKQRPELAQALALCKKTGATLAVAKLDRLARNVAFTSALLRSGLDFVVADMPLANRFTIHVIAAFAEYEHGLMCQQQRAARAAMRARGQRMGTLFSGPEARAFAAKGNATIKQQCDAFAAKMAPLLCELKSIGITTLQGMADALNARGIPAMRGGKWYGDTVRMIDLRGARVTDEGCAWIKKALDGHSKVAIRAIRGIRAMGVTSYWGIVRELNRLNIQPPNGGRWSHRLIDRLEAQAENWNLENHPHLTPQARAKLIRLLPIVHDLKQRGITGYLAIATALNEQGIEAPSHGRAWTRDQVASCLSKIAR